MPCSMSSSFEDHVLEALQQNPAFLIEGLSSDQALSVEELPCVVEADSPCCRAAGKYEAEALPASQFRNICGSQIKRSDLKNHKDAEQAGPEGETSA